MQQMYIVFSAFHIPQFHFVLTMAGVKNLLTTIAKGKILPRNSNVDYSLTPSAKKWFVAINLDTMDVTVLRNSKEVIVNIKLGQHQNGITTLFSVTHKMVLIFPRKQTLLQRLPACPIRQLP